MCPDPLPYERPFPSKLMCSDPLPYDSTALRLLPFKLRTLPSTLQDMIDHVPIGTKTPSVVQLNIT